MAKFEVRRHTDPSYVAPAPWDHWDDYAGCWTCRRCGAAAGFQLHNPSCGAVPHADEEVACSCYGCTIKRTRAGLAPPDRSVEPCDPVHACKTDGRCWTHSEWVDETRCDPPGACVEGARCAAHGGARG